MKHSRNFISAILLTGALAPAIPAYASSGLDFNPDKYTEASIEMPDGSIVKYRGYEGIYYVRNVEDPKYQTLNIYIPETIRENSPIFLRTYVGGYMAATAKTPSPSDATGRALKEGYVVCIPGSRGSNSTITTESGETVYTGTAPNGLLDLKAAIRYLKYNDAKIPGDSKHIVTDGTSAGGAMSALLGATGNNPEYEPYLKAMGAAEASDDVWAAVCYCPITDLNHADMEYEWLYGCTDHGVRHLDEKQIAVSDNLSALCPAYINSLGLKDENGNTITSATYKDYLKTYLIASAQKAKDEGAEIPDSIGFVFYKEAGGPGPTPDDRAAPSFGPGNRMPVFNRQSEFITGLDLDRYLTYVATMTPLKTPPAFDRLGVLTDSPSPENKVFGDKQGTPANFTDFSLRYDRHDPHARLSAEMTKRVHLMNPMDFIGENRSVTAPHWFIRHGAKDRDTSFLVPLNLATKLRNHGFDVNFALPWNRPHSGDYNLDDLFGWLDSLH